MSASAPPQQEPTTATTAAAASAISSAFPAPPPFYKSFTPTNIALLTARQSSGASHPPSESFFSTVEGEEAVVVGDLAHLVPPLPPQDGKYRSFGVLHDVRVLIPSCALLAYIILTPPRASRSPLKRKPPPHEPPHLLNACNPSRSLSFSHFSH